MRDAHAMKAAKIQDSIREILYNDWDPIGVAGIAPRDEYDAYIGQVYRALVSNGSEQDIVDLLKKIATEYMGGSGGTGDLLHRAARKLLAIDVRL